jgi:hypothetical protein
MAVKNLKKQHYQNSAFCVNKDQRSDNINKIQYLHARTPANTPGTPQQTTETTKTTKNCINAGYVDV